MSTPPLAGCRSTVVGPGATLAIDVAGPGGGHWTLRRDPWRWTLFEGTPDAPASATARLSGDTAWRLLFNRLTETDIAGRIESAGNLEIVRPLLTTRSVIV